MNVSFSDSGTLKCSIKERKGPEEEVTTSLFCSVHLSVLVPDSQLTVKPGDEATLDCQAHIDGFIEQIAWNKTDLKSEKYVFISGNHSHVNCQHPSFRGRVELRDPQKKEGDASVVLKNVTAADSGPYECVVSMSSEEQRRKTKAEFRRIVHLKVEDSGPKAGGNKDEGNKDEGNKDEGNKDEGNKDEGNKDEGNLRGRSGLIGLIVAGLVVISASVLISLMVKKRLMKKKSEQPAADEHQHLYTKSVEVQCESEV